MSDTPTTVVAEWVEAYRTAWEDADVAGAGALFTDDATYQVTPFTPPMTGRAAVEDYWRRVTSSQQERRITCTWLGAGPDEQFVHFRAELQVDGGRQVIDGMLAVRIDDHGRCTALREWWHSDADG
ncbi:nuclear transport factor 2 family protein [Egicoccus sp. AB-alg2]|uniref:nuclear transport factor 2 family protein n=1 Tax=Egicoccus sp. AB-alg2 TaxID=3242693 RepID=UPI00359D0B97